MRLGELAGQFGLALEGDGEADVAGLATLAAAQANQVSFLANPSYLPELEKTRAAAVIIAAEHAARSPVPTLISANPYADWARVAQHFYPPRTAAPGIHPSAAVAESARLAASASIAAHSVIGEGCQIGERVVIGPGCVIEDGAVIGDDSRLVARVFIGHDCQLGARVIMHPGVVIGADGFGLAMDKGQWLKVPQMGRVRVGDDCEIGANTTIDRGAIDDTELDNDVRLDNQVQIAHNVHIGAHSALAGCVGVAGSTRIGRYCMIAGASGIGGHITIADGVIITAMSTVLHSIDQPGQYGSGIPARPQRQWQRTLVRLGQLDHLARQLKRLLGHSPQQD
ncbi:MAG: UDP-3-O-(3-hydroxymyristoyl)glucosamine N-acyltransferase [Wenzhouxiangella sp.]